MRPELRARLLETFRGELGDHLERITEDILVLEEEPSAVEALRSLFRSAHTLKGAARAVGIGQIERLCHELEGRLSRARDGVQPLGEGDFAVLLAASDALRLCGAALGSERPHEVDEGLLEALRRSEPPPLGDAPGAVGASREGSPEAKGPEPPPTTGHPRDAPEQRSPRGNAGPAVTSRLPSVRVGVDKLDALQAAVGMLQVERARLQEHAVAAATLVDALEGWTSQWRRSVVAADRRGGSPRPGALATDVADVASATRGFRKDVAGLAASAKRAARSLERTTAEVTHATRSIRVRPFSEACEHLPRAVRDLGATLGKSARLRIVGKDTEVDRMVLEALKDPLLQLVRNAVDHGLEDPATRSALGKPPVGTVTVEAQTHGERLTVTVRDDGAGVDADRLRAAFALKGENAPRSDSALAERLLTSGVTSRAEATEVSGRGVGLDVVRVAVSQVHGSFDVHWDDGAGTTFTIVVPVSLATTRAVLVRLQSWVLALPTVYVARLLRPVPSMLRKSRGQHCLWTEDGTVPLLTLARVLGPPFREPTSLEASKVVVLQAGRKRTAVLVDELVREEQIVVQPATHGGIRIPLVQAATVLPSGAVVPVLDVPALLDAAAEVVHAAELPTAASDVEPQGRPRILVVDDSITTRTLERGILESSGYEVDTAADGSEAWLKLQERDFQLVVADVEMPRMDGFELCHAIRTSARMRELPVILVTGREGPEDRQRGLEAGADAYIAKSAFDQVELLETTRQLLGGGVE